MMEITLKRIIFTVIVFVVLLGLVVAVAQISVRPEASHLLVLGLFLFFFGGITVGASIGIARSGLPPWIRSIRGQLMLVAIVVAILAVLSLGIVSYLMFISSSDLWLLLGLTAFSMGLSVILSSYLSRPTTRNVQKVIAAVREIDAGKLEMNVPVESRDEIGELATAFNAMAIRFRESLERERGLERSRRELVEAVSHDLRNPLASLRAVIESINDGVVSDEETVKRYLQTAQAEIEYISQLVNDLFDLSRIDAGMLSLKKELVSPDQIVTEAVELASSEAARRQITVEGDRGENLPDIQADPVRLQRVLYNLVQNAMLHTPPGGFIRLGARYQGDDLEVRVSDTGGGIPESDLTKIFERGYWLKEGSRRTRGNGLGLSISRGIIEAHGGSIRAANLPGGGSVFSFKLPR